VIRRQRRFRIGPEGHLVISQRARWDSRLSLIACCVLCGAICLIIAALLLAIMSTPSRAADAMIECRHQPGDGSWGWRIIDGQKCWYQGRRVIAKEQLRWPHEAAPSAKGQQAEPAAQPSWLERSAANAPPAQILFPVIHAGSILETYPLVVWPQPWFSSESVMRWPLLLDVDRVPFTAWSKRIGQ
jgi:hypothetical protein